MKSYPIAESFLSFQGEGVHYGRRAFFIRLFGCSVKCPWCDSKYAWSGAPDSILSATELANLAKESGAEMVVITGGEPCLHNLEPLLAELIANSLECNLETSGTLPIRESDGARFDWVALSPKLFSLPLEENLLRADELKMIVSDSSELSTYTKIAERATNAKALWLEPEWSRAKDKELLNAIADFVGQNGGRYRAGWQVHKNYFAR